MHEQIVQLIKKAIMGQVRRLARGSIYEMPNGLLESEAKKLTLH